MKVAMTFRRFLPLLLLAAPAAFAESEFPLRAAAIVSEGRLELPVNGAVVRFDVRPSEVLSAELEARYPHIRTYAGWSAEDPALTVRLTLDRERVRGVVMGRGEPLLLEPASSGYTLEPLSRAGRRGNGGAAACRLDLHRQTAAKQRGRSAVALNVADFRPLAQVRTFRMAISTTANFTRSAGSAEAIVAIVANVMNLVNGVFERDVAIRFRVVEVFPTLEPGEPFDDDDAGASFEANQAFLDQNLGSSKYDIGHVFSLGKGNGLGNFESLCDDATKAQGLSDFGYSDKPEIIALDMIAHEMGHQLNARHTFNSLCGGTAGETSRDETSAVEIGGGATIMGYTGNCTSEPPVQDLQAYGNGHFHAISIQQMVQLVRKREGCEVPAATARTNQPPRVLVPDVEFVIPARTPFVLTGLAMDPDAEDSGRLTYSWEQVDRADRPSPPVVDDGVGPLFRNYEPARSGDRLFPSPQYLLAGNIIPLLYSAEGREFLTGEILPQTSRSMTFRLAVRDNRRADNSVAGAVGFADQRVRTVAEAGPFQVTRPGAAVAWAAGSTQSIAWDVARTDQAPISCSMVRVGLLLNLESLAIVADNLPNTGQAQITIPASIPATQRARLIVACVGNVFLDFSDHDIQITN